MADITPLAQMTKVLLINTVLVPEVSRDVLLVHDHVTRVTALVQRAKVFLERESSV